MDPKFAEVVEQLAPKLKLLLAMAPCRDGDLPADMPAKGVYLFTENGNHMYVGRSNDLRGRYGRHCLPGATHRMAAFAFKLTRIKTGHVEATYTQEGSRAWLMQQQPFIEAFARAKARIRRMEYRCVGEDHQTRQALLEIYVATVLEAKHNDFKTT